MKGLAKFKSDISKLLNGYLCSKEKLMKAWDNDFARFYSKGLSPAEVVNYITQPHSFLTMPDWKNETAESIKKYIDTHDDLNDWPRAEDWSTTLLMFAIQGNAKLEVIKTLVEAGCDVNAIDDDYNTVLDDNLTMEHMTPEIYEYLISQGAKPNKTQIK